MTYPKHPNKRGTDRFTAPSAKGGRNTFSDPLASPGPNSTNDHYDPRSVPPAPKPGGREPERRVAPYTGSATRGSEPQPRNVTSPGKVRRVQP